MKLQNAKGEWNYHFNWIDEAGRTVGFNDVWASSKREAVKKARAMESPARDYEWGRHTGMYVNPGSMYRATAHQAREMDRLGWMMTC